MLPADCWAEIFSHLPPWHRPVMSLVCRLFRDLARTAIFSPYLLIVDDVGVRQMSGMALLNLSRPLFAHEPFPWRGLHLKSRETCAYRKGRLFYSEQCIMSTRDVALRKGYQFVMFNLTQAPVSVRISACQICWVDLLSGQTGALPLAASSDVYIRFLLADVNGVWCVADEQLAFCHFQASTPLIGVSTLLPRVSVLFIHDGVLHAVTHPGHPEISIYRASTNLNTHPQMLSESFRPVLDWILLSSVPVDRHDTGCFRRSRQCAYACGQLICCLGPRTRSDIDSQFIRYCFATNSWDKIPAAPCTELFAAGNCIYRVPEFRKARSEWRREDVAEPRRFCVLNEPLDWVELPAVVTEDEWMAVIDDGRN
eukprot:TRINITY_DN8966_c0_g2_i1.p1 TRINITY_DN8966_c0_g2~~TRINITY_DN8966_c0_g2_i1.p1  ORF type:complete len:368 (-),score=41.17 TRINITY_DN8966_c0_g2_i1:3-1106(-)